ncbi:hypothetical protein I2486_11635 [Cellulophaga sp. E16_2]|uniref:Uncharacterized protein n=1 Tax=Cellulophaga algicola (strain DSM 14237 / IC166 / ACAM 630) TaxID=688270 RepID=E6X7C6_CELAD|nr:MULTISPECIES: hypothetical protein [Cellulophaga]ADV49608.1 hypothetical protein Celal_2316 [Cellulophaga algicola DSM 14237]MBO0592058.1 hypothetical protein [Cellulophaga sp. E16_2]
MDLPQRLAFCKKCEKRTFDPNLGIVCSLTQRKPDFISNCNDFIIDPKEASKIAAKSYAAQSAPPEESGSFSIWGVIGLILIVIRLIFFFGRL